MGTSPGTKLVGVPTEADLNGCGGSPNNDSGVGPDPVAVYNIEDGDRSVDVSWDVTIPHGTSPGTRIAVKYAEDNEGFNDNVLTAGGATPPFDETVDNSEAGRKTLRVTLPEGKTGSAVLQWVWASTTDGGWYVGCADIAVVDGAQAEEAVTAAGLALREARGGDAADNVVKELEEELGLSGVEIAGIAFAVIAIALFGVWCACCRSRKRGDDGGDVELGRQSGRRPKGRSAAKRTSGSSGGRSSGRSSERQGGVRAGDKVTAKYKYKAAQHDEMSLRKGSSYTVIKVLGDGWIKVKARDGSTGVAPGNYF
jgi:hypothetical protein